MRVSFIFFLVIPALLFSDTIHVPGDYGTIQVAIDAAVNGDTVLVAPGTYVEKIDFLGKAITVMSSSGAESTIIDGQQAGSVVTFENAEGLDSILHGFTITNGRNINGGGVLTHTATSPLIRNNIVEANTASNSGGGIYCYGSAPVIVGNTIARNHTEDMYGGGIYCMFASPVITNNLIYRNWASVGAFSMGGGISCHLSPMQLTNNILAGNKADWGGAINLSESPSTITCNTFHENTAAHLGGAIRCTNSMGVTLANSILWKNDAPQGPVVSLGTQNYPSSISISHCDVEGGSSSIFVGPGSSLYWGVGNLDADPLLVDAVAFDFHLRYTSPCRDAGDASTPGMLALDFEGDPRVAYGEVDMGADEFFPHLYTTGDATPGGQVEGKLVGLPGTSQVGLWFGSGVLYPPLPSIFGLWYLAPPWIGPIVPGTVPPSGVIVLPATLPASPPAPYDLHLQALMGNAFTNYCVLRVL